ncbi:hypothetical protein RMATCC62417_11095 [Rhizopus microsporus]|nr:hypothetical protein RMATCC62417_11095 [Rhizopus microsporus]
MQANIRRFVREVPKIEGGEWATSEAINKEFVQELRNERLTSTTASTPSIKTLNAFAPVPKQMPTSIMTYDKHMRIKAKKNSSGTSNNSAGLQSTDFTPARRWAKNPKEVLLKISNSQTTLVTWWKMGQVKNGTLWTTETVEKIYKARYNQVNLQGAIFTKRDNYGGGFRGRRFFNGRGNGFLNRGRNIKCFL